MNKLYPKGSIFLQLYVPTNYTYSNGEMFREAYSVHLDRV